MNKDNFYINDLSEIRAFCINSDKEDVYKYIYSLQQENEASKRTINELTKQIAKLVEYKKQLKDNWNKLKEFAQEKIDNPSWASCGARYVLEKMQELESSDSNE